MFKDVFVKYLQSKGITAYKVAKETGIPQGRMNEYKNGKITPTTENLIKIADYLDCSIDFLLGRKEVDITKQIQLTEPEKKLLDVFRMLNDKGQIGVQMYAETQADKPEYQKYTDIPKEA